LVGSWNAAAAKYRRVRRLRPGMSAIFHNTHTITQHVVKQRRANKDAGAWNQPKGS
jgi:hypothetical protein